MTHRGFFARLELDPDLAYIDLGKNQCERRLLATSDKATEQYRRVALATIRKWDPGSPRPSECPKLAEGTPKCGSGDKPWADLPTACLVVHSVGKNLLRSAVEKLDEHHETNTPPRTAHWLADMLPSHDPAVLDPARLAWSWGLRSRPRLRTA